ncbi:MAG: M48 family peptidase [Candidatus Acididesulfobacter guangdongensis]|uniref:M48 family peptidase n=1 Tax=Acididesulfobacter guangdongensis TaxID=2597225 RepID=A0A519BJB6_ACIG2|nr:MAG: M48 family peptidase [Candidatus Acididesulfobacter guangdongensis]
MFEKIFNIIGKKMNLKNNALHRNDKYKKKFINTDLIKKIPDIHSVINPDKIEKIIKSRRKSVTLEITPSATLIIRLPLNYTESGIYNLLKKNEKWLNEKFELMESKKYAAGEQKLFVSGEKFLLLGKKYTLKIIDGNENDFKLALSSENISSAHCSLSILDNFCLLHNENSQSFYIFNIPPVQTERFIQTVKNSCIEIEIIPKNKYYKYECIGKKTDSKSVNYSENRRNFYTAEDYRLFFENFYKYKASAVISQRIKVISDAHGFKYKKIGLTSAKKRWGSCSYNDCIRINWRLIMAPTDIIDYVIIHELSHTIHKNHSKNFWNYVGLIMPDYKIRIKWLKDNGHMLKLD